MEVLESELLKILYAGITTRMQCSGNNVCCYLELVYKDYENLCIMESCVVIEYETCGVALTECGIISCALLHENVDTYTLMTNTVMQYRCSYFGGGVKFGVAVTTCLCG